MMASDLDATQLRFNVGAQAEVASAVFAVRARRCTPALNTLLRRAPVSTPAPEPPPHRPAPLAI